MATKTKKPVALPEVGSAWKWVHLPDQGRLVEQIIEKPFGTFIVFVEIFEGKQVDVKVTSADAWVKASKGQRPYLSPLVPKATKLYTLENASQDGDGPKFFIHRYGGKQVGDSIADQGEAQRLVNCLNDRTIFEHELPGERGD